MQKKKKTLTGEQLLEAVRRLAVNKGREWVSREEFVRETGIPFKHVLTEFLRWNAFIEAAGLKPLDERGRPDIEKGYSREKLMGKLRELAQQNKTDVITESEFTHATGISYRPIHRHFGNWNQFVTEAGLKPHPMQKTRIPDDLLLDDYLQVLQRLNGRHPSYFEFEQHAKYSMGTYEKRFDGFKGYRRAAILRGIQLGILQASIADDFEDTAPPRTEGIVVHQRLDDRPVLGEEINVPGLVHAPVNEMGVVYLFGTLAEKLGFRVESFNPTGFPDCEARRRSTKGTWQRVRIEFEYRSSNFLDHRHDIAKCDVIVCWVHDWKDCPLDVCCLRDVIASLKRG